MIEAVYYHPIFYNVVLFLCIFQYMRYGNQMSSTLLYRENTKVDVVPFFFFIVLIVFMGFRPISFIFGDTGIYAREYQLFKSKEIIFDMDKEWLFEDIQSFCQSAGFGVSFFFFIIEVGYIGMIYWACKRLMENNVWIAMMFCISAFSFFSYGVNGIRNGLACSVLLLALSFFVNNKMSIIIGILLSFFAYGIHHTAILPFTCAMVSVFFIKDIKNAIVIWVLSIFISLVAGNTISSFFANMGFDDRATSYLTAEMDSTVFSNVGFRWDFLLYSAMPIWLAYYVRVKKGICDSKYSLLANTYILTNAFWVMVIRASFSNRFAYLSWFLYPIVLAYPLLKLPLWKNQNQKTVLILMIHVLFTYFMWLIGK